MEPRINFFEDNEFDRTRIDVKKQIEARIALQIGNFGAAMTMFGSERSVEREEAPLLIEYFQMEKL